MADTFRALCAELVDIITAHANPDDYAVGYVAEMLTRARAALADEPAAPEGREPAAVTGQPSDEDLRDLWSWAAGQDQGPWPTQHHCFARAVLARWGNPAPTPPADGEQRVMTDLTPEHTSRRTEGDLHPEVREAYKYVDSVVATADFEHPLAWCGWALREAFLAGCTHARAALPPAIISDLSFSHPQTAMAEQRSDLHQLALQALKGVHEQREEILRAFVAKYQCQPDDAVQAMQTTVEGDRHVTRYWIEKSKRMPAPPSDGEVAELMECPACEGTPKPGNQPCAVCGRHVPTPPADGEVAELVKWLRSTRTARLTRAAELLQRQALVPVSVSERMPEPSTKVLAHYVNDLGKGRTICAIWVPAKSRSDEGGHDDFTEYDEEDDKFYWPEGWYEAIENWDELDYVKVYEGEVVCWQPLPKWPACALPLPEVGE